MKTYYDILEISRYASKEVLERAHKALVKKYHPDLESDAQKKKEKEEYIKKINAAYEVLSDEKKKKEYDLKVFGAQVETEDKTTSESDDVIIDQKVAKDMEYERANAAYAKMVDEEIKKAQERIDQEEKIIKENLKKYERAYLRSLGYDVSEPIQWKSVGITILSVIILLFLFWIIYLIPPFRNSINTQIEENTAIGMVFHIIKSLYIGLGSLFKTLFTKK